MATWHTADSVRADWLDAEQISDPTLLELLAVAQAQIIAYAPKLTVGDSDPSVTQTVDGAQLTLTRKGNVVTGVVSGVNPNPAAANPVFPQPDGFRSNSEWSIPFFGPWDPTATPPRYKQWWISASMDWSHFGDGAKLYGKETDFETGIPDGATFVYLTEDDMPTVPGAEIPDAWRLAQRMQTQNLYNAARVDPQGGLGGDGESFVIRPHPLDWQVKALLRPNRGRPRVR